MEKKRGKKWGDIPAIMLMCGHHPLEMPQRFFCHHLVMRSRLAPFIILKYEGFRARLALTLFSLNLMRGLAGELRRRSQTMVKALRGRWGPLGVWESLTGWSVFFFLFFFVLDSQVPPLSRRPPHLLFRILG